MGNIKWGLVALTTSMFSCSTVAVVLNINALSSSCIGPVDQAYFILPGPLGTKVWSTQNGVAIAFTVMFVLNQWQADGLLVSSVSKQAISTSNIVRFFSFTVVMLSVV